MGLRDGEQGGGSGQGRPRGVRAGGAPAPGQRLSVHSSRAVKEALSAKAAFGPGLAAGGSPEGGEEFQNRHPSKDPRTRGRNAIHVYQGAQSKGEAGRAECHSKGNREGV